MSDDGPSYYATLRLWIMATKRRKGDTTRNMARRITCKTHKVRTWNDTLASADDVTYIYAEIIKMEGGQDEVTFSPSDFPL